MQATNMLSKLVSSVDRALALSYSLCAVLSATRLRAFMFASGDELANMRSRACLRSRAQVGSFVRFVRSCVWTHLFVSRIIRFNPKPDLKRTRALARNTAHGTGSRQSPGALQPPMHAGASTRRTYVHARARFRRPGGVSQ